MFLFVKAIFSCGYTFLVRGINRALTLTIFKHFLLRKTGKTTQKSMNRNKKCVSLLDWINVCLILCDIFMIGNNKI